MWHSPAIQKTLSLILLIVLGVLLRSKVKDKQSLAGIKVLILSVALPAMIFIALLKIKVEPHLLFLPVLALGTNLVLFGTSHRILPWFGVSPKSAMGRTLLMLLPSLAPGLSCFPFLIEFLGDQSLALAALADVGNKVFVLILLYVLAMRWHYQHMASGPSRQPQKGKLKSLLIALAREPVNVLIIAALVMLAFGAQFSALPAFLQSTFSRTSAMMTPMILLFIGMAVQLRREQVKTIFSFLALRAAMGFALSAVFLLLVPGLAPAIALVVVVFPQSACSFWPYAHMAAVDTMEREASAVSKTFDTETALAVLACSLPVSTLLIMAICSIGSFFTNPWVLFAIAGGCILAAFARRLLESLTQKARTAASNLGQDSSSAAQGSLETISEQSGA